MLTVLSHGAGQDSATMMALWRRDFAIQMEDNARPYLKKIKGLWGNGIKGTRKPESKRPGSWRQFLEEQGLLEFVETMGKKLMDKQPTRNIWELVKQNQVDVEMEEDELGEAPVCWDCLI